MKLRLKRAGNKEWRNNEKSEYTGKIFSLAAKRSEAVFRHQLILMFLLSIVIVAVDLGFGEAAFRIWHSLLVI